MIEAGFRYLKTPEKKMISIAAVTMGNLQNSSHSYIPLCSIGRLEMRACILVFFFVEIHVDEGLPFPSIYILS